jgi:putative transposase
VHLRHPIRHRRRWRSTNLLERSLGEVKRRTKVIGRFPGETSCLALVWAVLDLYISHATDGIRLSQLEHQRLNRLADHLVDSLPHVARRSRRRTFA